jgi:hypothetical protein
MISPLLEFKYVPPNGEEVRYNFLGRRDRQIATLSELRADVQRHLDEVKPDDPDFELITGSDTQQLQQIDEYLATRGDFNFEYTPPPTDEYDDFEDDEDDMRDAG